MATLAIKVSIQEDGNTIFVTDEGTVWGTPDRAGIALVCYTRYNGYGVDPVIVTDVGMINYNPANTNSTISSFAVPYEKDGWHTFHLIVIPTSASDTEGNIRFNTGMNRLEIYENGAWIALTSDKWDYMISDDYLRVTQESMMYSKISIETNCLWDEIVAKKCKDMKCASEKFWFMRGQIYSLLNNFYIGNRYEAQRMMENVTQYADNIS